MNKKAKILIFEDNSNYIETASLFLCRFSVIRRIKIEVVIGNYEGDYEKALTLIRSGELAAAFVDIFVPGKNFSKDLGTRCLELLKTVPDNTTVGHAGCISLNAIANEIDREIPIGLLLGEELQKEKIPFVLVTDLYHHDIKGEAVFQFSNKMNYGGYYSPYWGIVEGGSGKGVRDGETFSFPDKALHKDQPEYWERALKTLFCGLLCR